MQISTVPPAAPPLGFKANDLPVIVLTLDSDTASAMPLPVAVYSAPVGQVELNAQFVDWHVVQQSGRAIIRVDRDGLIHALRPGEARIEGRMGTALSSLRVIVRTTQE
jgi:hypothetical protein